MGLFHAVLPGTTSLDHGSQQRITPRGPVSSGHGATGPQTGDEATASGVPRP